MKGKYFKKGDKYIIAFCIIFLIISLLIINKVFKSTKNDKVNIIYRNTLIIEANITEENNYLIKSNEDLTKILIYKNNIFIKDVDIIHDEFILNEISISNEYVKIINANCNNKDCMRMIISKNSNNSIICTNGIVIKLVDEERFIDIIP